MRAFLRQGAIGTLLLAAFLTTALSHGQDSTSKRKVVERTATPYPALARSMALEGVVKFDVLVASDGTVKSLETKGGHPVLAQAAANAVRRWKWEPAPRDSHELVEVKYAPQ